MSEETNLTELPEHILENTIDYLGLDSRISLRKSCKILRWLTDKRRIEYKWITVTLDQEMIKIEVGGSDRTSMAVEYCDRRNGCLVKTARKQKLLEKEDYVNIALRDLKSYISNARASIEQLSIFYPGLRKAGSLHTVLCQAGSLHGFQQSKQKSISVKRRRIFPRMKELLESLNHQLSVKNVRFDYISSDDVMCILPFLKPGILEKIRFDCVRIRDWTPITETEQWKEARHLQAVRHPTPEIETLLHFRNVDFSSDTFTLEELKTFIEVASQPPFTHQYHCFVEGDMPDRAIRNYLRNIPNLSRSPRTQTEKNFHHIKIPNSNCYVQIHISQCGIDTRTVREATLFDPEAYWVDF